MPRGLGRGARGIKQGARGNRGFQIGKTVAQDRAEIDRFIAVNEAPGLGAVDLKTCELHGMSLG